MLLLSLTHAAAFVVRVGAQASESTESTRANPQEVAPSPEPAGYREAIEHALNELRLEHYSEARAMFARAHTLFPNARALRGIGLAEFAQRRYVDSIEHLEQALAHPVRPLAEQLRSETEELVARARGYVTQLQLSVRPAHAEVTVDGAPLVSPTRPQLLSAGEHVIGIECAGYRRQERRVSALGGDVQRVFVNLEPLPADLSSTAEQGRRLGKNPWLWSGIGAVVAGAAITATVLATRKEPRTEPPYGGGSDVVIVGF